MKWTKEMQKQIQEKFSKLQARQQELKKSAANAARFIDMVKKYERIHELTLETMWIFVRHIEVDEHGKKYFRSVPREIKIYTVKSGCWTIHCNA